MLLEKTQITYNDKIVRHFVAASVTWGIVGMLVGALVALQLAFWQANVPPFLTFGRLRPLHTNAVIFAFVGNMIFAGIYYSSQRLLKTRLPSDLLAKIHFWGWQGIIVAAAITLPLGFTQGKEYAELEWPIDLAIAVIWIIFAVNFFWMLKRRNEKHLYVALWFYIATIVTVTVLHVVNSLAVPVGLFKSYSLFGGVQDALVQWWYGHNAVAFFLTTPVLGIMYYFIPKAAERPVYSYRLSIVHFWALVFLYIWAGPHHLLNTALPDWAQSLGMVFSLMLWAPSWGGMINGLLTLRGAWDKLRTDPVLKFFAAAVTFYGMVTFEGPLLSIKAVSGLAHYTDWIIGHVHSGALGWNGFMAAGMFYFLVPRLYKTKLYSPGAANFHFYTGTFGILLYVISMWVAGVTQGLMWREVEPDGGLSYDFLVTIHAMRGMYWTRLLGGLMYLSGFILMAWNLVMTARSGSASDETAEVTYLAPAEPTERKWTQFLYAQPVAMGIAIVSLLVVAGFANPLASFTFVFLALLLGMVSLGALMFFPNERGWHHALEGRALPFTVLTVVAVLIGGAAEIIPSIVSGASVVRGNGVEPYSALELEGRDVYLAEGCYNCHSQMIRPFTWETTRYGDVSTAEESAFDHPFQWGSKRNGPDLSREGSTARRPDSWHYEHMLDPRLTSPGSTMPPYPHLLEDTIDFSNTASKLRAMKFAGVPYTVKEIQTAESSARAQSEAVVASLYVDFGNENAGIKPNSKLVALIAYLQRLGNPPMVEDVTSNEASTGKEAE